MAVISASICLGLSKSPPGHRVSLLERAILKTRCSGAVRVLHLDPDLGPAGLIGAIEPFRDDALASEFACVLEHDPAVFGEMVNVPGAIVRPRNQPLQVRLALAELSAPPVRAVE